MEHITIIKAIPAGATHLTQVTIKQNDHGKRGLWFTQRVDTLTDWLVEYWVIWIWLLGAKARSRLSDV